MLAAARAAQRFAEAGEVAAFAAGGATGSSDAGDAGWRSVPAGHPDAAVTWLPGSGWELTLPAGDPRRAGIDLYLPICSATLARPVTVGHLGQSLDGFIATHAGESRWITGEENILHLHRLRALCDAVIVGAGTVAADDPQLTTRLVPGPNPLRVVLDPTRRLGGHHRVFNDGTAETLYVCDRSLVHDGESGVGLAAIRGLGRGADGMPGTLDLAELVRFLRGRGCARIFVEGGGVTVSMFLEANLLDRLHLAIAPLLIGEGRPAIRLPAPAILGDCHRPRCRVFRMGADVLFDCDLRTAGSDVELPSDTPPVTRII